MPCLPLRPGACGVAGEGGLHVWYLFGVFLAPPEEGGEKKVAAAVASEKGTAPWLLRSASRLRVSSPKDVDSKDGKARSESPRSRLERRPSQNSQASSESRLSKLRRALSRNLSWKAPRPNFHGTWVCTQTWSLDPFLKSIGASKLERVAASRAPWPSWEFSQKGDAITFVNHTCFGKLREEFEVGGPEYTMIDARKQRQTCRALWEGSALVIERRGPQGRFREERRVDPDGSLQFVLRGLEPGKNGSWGRVFRRK